MHFSILSPMILIYVVVVVRIKDGTFLELDLGFVSLKNKIF